MGAAMRRLPPLTAIEAFVQVARLGSVKAAAEDLALSSPALSRRVQALERFMGRSLFERRHQAMVLSTDGEVLLSRIAPALDALTLAIDATSGDTELVRLRLGVMPLFASQRLMGRLPELRRKHPELHIDIETGGHALARLGEGVDAAIVLARDVDSSLYSRRIDRDTAVAIVNRSMLEGRFPVRQIDDIGRLTIFLHRDMPEIFNVWREAMGRPDLEPAAVDVFDSGQLMLDAAAQGLGVAFMLRSHLEDSHDDRLTKLFDEAVDSPYGYWFACRRPALTSRAVRVFHDWLFSTF
jgi:LysR family transcriptional regulator, glycine cleavage system transcriptional activator